MAEHSHPRETINNLYELPTIETTIIYLHAEAEFSTKDTWIKSIWKRDYLTWTIISTKNVTNIFPGSEETQKGHMRWEIQGVLSNKPV